MRLNVAAAAGADEAIGFFKKLARIAEAHNVSMEEVAIILMDEGLKQYKRVRVI